MHKGRLEAFTDAVIAIIMTLMVLDLRPPRGADLAALQALAPEFCSYLLSFVFLAIYWNNHHHMLQATKHVNGTTLWANMHLLLWLSLIPFATSWMGAHDRAVWPTALYGFVLFMCGVAYFILARVLIGVNGRDSEFARSLGKDTKGIASVCIYALAICLAFVAPVAAYTLYVLVALIWFVPDRRFEKS